MKPEHITVLEPLFPSRITPELIESRLGKLPLDIKAKWLDALRSNKYVQARGELRKTFSDGATGYCCLGVACDVDDPSRWHRNFGSWAYALCSTDLSDELRVEWGLRAAATGILVLLNDELEWTFAQIADFIEEVL